MANPKMRDETKRNPTGTQLLDKALDMVDLIEQSSQRLSANAVALASGYPKPTVNRILSALVRRGFLAVDRRDQTYELGMRFMQMAATLRRNHRLVALVEEELTALSARTGESVSLGIPEPTAVRIVGRYQLGLETLPGGPAGARRPYHASAIGKAMLANIGNKRMNKLIDHIDFTRYTPKTLMDRAALLPNLELVQARGYAFDDEEIVTGVRCVAVPLFAVHGEMCGAISLSAPVHRMSADRINEIVAALSAIAEKVLVRLHVPRTDGRNADDITCLRTGGLFHPIAITANDDNIHVVDAAAPAIHSFSREGELQNTQRLDYLPNAAAFGPDGVIAIAGQTNVEILQQDRRKITPLKVPAKAMTFTPDGCLLAATGKAVHDAMSGARLFALDGDVRAIAATQKRLYALRADTIEMRGLGDGKLLRRFPVQHAIGAYSAIAADDQHIFVCGPDTWQLTRIDTKTGMETKLVMPERSITALALTRNGLLIAGANLYASLIDKVEHNSGSIYRMAGPARH